MEFDIYPLLGWWNTRKIGWTEEFFDILTVPTLKESDYEFVTVYIYVHKILQLSKYCKIYLAG